MAKEQLFVANFGASSTGLATVGYTLYRTNGTVYASRSTSGVVEYGSSGIYGASISRPDEDIVVLWDTGTGKYAAEDSRVMIDSIANETDKIKIIWNSIKNQGDFLAVLMEKLGLLEKNKGLSKEDVQGIVDSSVKSIKIPEVKIPEPAPFPEIPDYSGGLRVLESQLKSISDRMNSMTPKEYSSNFKNLEEMISRSISILNGNSAKMKNELSSDLSNKAKSLAYELDRIKSLFAGFDTVIGMVGKLNVKMAELDANDKDITNAEKEIREEIRRLNVFINMLASAERAPRDSKADEMMLMFGHKMK